MANTSVKVSLEVADGAAQKALQTFTTNAKAADAALGKLGDNSSGVFGKLGVDISSASSAFEVFQGTLVAGVALKAIGLLADAAKAMFQTFIVDGVKSAEQYEVALNQLNVALAGSGNYSAQASKQFEDFASKIQATTRYSDDAVLSGTALLESMSRLGPEGLERASKDAIDLAAALQIDLQTAFELVGKAAEGNVTALKKHGLAVETAATNSQTLSNALRAIEERFGGSAAAQVQTYAGSVDVASHSFEDLQKSIGQVITENPVITAAIGAVATVFKEWTDSVIQNKSGLIQLVAEGIIPLIKGANLVVTSIDLVYRAGKFLVNELVAAFAELTTVLVAPFAIFSEKAKSVFDSYSEMARNAAKRGADAFSETTGLQKLGEALGVVQAKAEDAFANMKDGATQANPAINNSTKSVTELSDALKIAVEAGEKLGKELANQANSGVSGFKNATSEAKSNLDEQLADSEDHRNQIGKLDQEYIDKQTAAYKDFYAAQSDAQDEQYDNDQKSLDLAFKNKKLTATQYDQAQRQLDKNYETQMDKNDAEELKSTTELNKKKKQLNDQYFTDAATIAGNFATLMNSKNRDLFEIGKAASIAQATINTYEGATKAFAQSGILGFALGASVIAAGLVQVANIASTDYSYATGGVVGDVFRGATMGGDNVTANLRTGEMVLNADQQRRLFDIANGSVQGGNNSDQIAGLTAVVANLAAQPIVVAIDGKQLITATRTQLRSGRTFT